MTDYNVPSDLQKYDTPDARQAYQSYVVNQKQTQAVDHGDLPQELWGLDTPANRQRFQEFTLGEQNRVGLQTSDGRTYSFSDDQLAFVSQRYKSTWQYQHNDEDLLAQQNGQLPPSLYSNYSKKSAYDQWAMQMGMPNEKELEKYLGEYDEYLTDVGKYVDSYNAKVEEHNAKIAQLQADDELLNAFYGDVGDRLYRAEFNGVQRGSSEWRKIFYDALNESQYSALLPYFSGSTDPVASAGEGILSLASTLQNPFGAEEEEEEKAPAEKLTAKQKKERKKLDKDVPDYDTYFEKTAREKWGDLFPKFEALPELPTISFSEQDFENAYNATVTGSESARGTGRINDTIRSAAGKIGYTEDGQSFAAGSADGRGTGGSNSVYSLSGSVKGGRSGSFGDNEASHGRAKYANETDVSAVCKDLVVQGFNTEDYWLVIGGLSSGTPASKNPYGPGFAFDEDTQRKVAAYGSVISTRYGTDVMQFVVNGATDEELQAFVAKAVDQGATREMLENAYNVVMTALGGSEDSDASRDWDGLSAKARKKQDADFGKAFSSAISAAPSIPIGSGWTGKYQTREERDAIIAKRGEFDLEQQFASDKYRRFDKEAAESYWGSLTPEERMADTKVSPDDFTIMGAVEKMSEGHSPATYNAYELAGRYATLQQFREDAKKHGYSDWEIDQFFRRKGYTDQAPWETTEEYDARKAQNYRQYLIESANIALIGEDPVSELDAEHRRVGHGGTGGKLYADPVIEYFNSISDADLAVMMNLDASTDNWEQAWTIAPAMMITRGAYTYAASFVNFADMVAHQGTGTDSWEVAKNVNETTQRLASFYRKNNQSKFVATLTDAGSEMVRMWLTAQTGGMFGSATGSLLGAAYPEAAAWLQGGTKLAKLVGWGIESVPFVTGAMGSSYAEARSEGATNKQAAAYGVLAGLVEGLTEKVSVELLIGEGGQKLVNWTIGKLMNSGASSLLKGVPGVLLVNVLKMFANAGIEASEESASYVLDLLLKKAIYDPRAKWSWSEFKESAGMGALCGALGLAFQNYGASYINSMMEFAVSSPENMQKFANFAMKQYGVNLGTDGNYVVKAEDYDPSKILPASEWNEAWKNYLDANAALSAAQKQYEATVASLDEDDAQKARDVMYWKNQIAAGDPNDATSANAMVHAMEQLTLAESKQADTAKKNERLRQDARTELNNARKRAQNTMTEASAKIRAHSRSEIAATLSVIGDAAALDSNYDLAQTDDTDPARKRFDNARAYAESVGNAISALDALEQATEAQREAKARLYGAAVSTLVNQYSDKPVLAGAVAAVNRMAQAEVSRAENLEAAADGLTEEIRAEKQRQEQRTADYHAELDAYDDLYESMYDEAHAEAAEAYEAYKNGELTDEQYQAAKVRVAEQLAAAREAREENRRAATLAYAADGGDSVAMQGLADSLRVEASEARAKADNIRNAVVRALAYRTQEAALAAIDETQNSEGVLTAEQREAMTDEMNQIVAEGLISDEATQKILDALGDLEAIEQQTDQKTEKAPAQTASETQEAPVQSEQQTTTVTPEERQAELDKAVAIGKALGIDVQIVDNLPKGVGARYLNDGTVQIGRNTDKAPIRLLVHELAHYMEGTKAYEQLQQYVFAQLGQDPGFNLNVEIAAYRQLYADAHAEAGDAALSDEDAINEAKAEIVSRWCENNLFTDEQSVNRLCAERQSLGKRILSGIQNMLAGNRGNPAAKELLTAEKLYIKALHQAKAFGGAKINRNRVTSLLVGAGLYVDTEGGAFKVYRNRYDGQGNRVSTEELKPNMDSPVDGPITTDDIMNHSPIGAFIKLGQKYGNIEGFKPAELEQGTNLRAIPTENLSTAAQIVNLFTDLSNMCLAYGDNQMVWDFIGGYVFSSITSNSDPQYSRTVDFGTICRKTQNLVTAMSEAMVEKGRGLYAEEIIELQNAMINGKKSIDAPCSMCYVFNRWLGLGGYLNRIKVYQDRYAAMSPAQALAAFRDVQAQLESIVNPAEGAGNYEALIKDLAAKHGLDAQTYLDQIAEVNKAFGEKGWVRGRKDGKVAMSEARTKSIQIYAQFLEDCLARYDLKGVKDPSKLAIYQEVQQRMELTDAYGWFTKVLLNQNKKGDFALKKSVLSADSQSWALGADGNASFVVPTDVLFDLNASDQFATQYPDVWRFRTSGGSALGKATYGYTDARLGEFTYGAAVSNVKSQEVAKAPRYGINAEKSTSKNQPKNKLSFVNSKGEFASGGEKTFFKAMQNVMNQAWLGGDRMQSSSDYTSKNALDYLITAFEMQCLGAPVQTYSKVPEGISFFDAIGASVNISMIGRGKGYKGSVAYEYDENAGRWKVKPGATLDFSTIQGVDPEVARALSTVSNSAQPIVVGMNREHCALVLGTPWITMCIPVHMSGGTVDNISARAVAQGDPALSKADINDATDSQNDKALSEEELVKRYGKEEAAKKLLAREIRKSILSGKMDLSLINQIAQVDSENGLLRAMYETFSQNKAALKIKDDNPLGVGIYPNEYWDSTSTIENADVNGDRFQEYCEMLGVLPRFSYGNYGEQGQPGDPDYFPGLNKVEGYWKVLIDRKMYNTDGTYRTQQAVDISGLTANMLNGTAPTSLAARLNDYYANEGNRARRDAWFSETYDKVGRDRPSTGTHLFNAEENARLQQQQAAAAEVGKEYGQNMTGNAAEAMEAHARYALSGDVEARLAELRKQYGSMTTPEHTETAPGRENVVLPTQTTEDTYVRRAAQTFMRSPNVTDAAASDIGRAVLRGEFNYERQTNEQTESNAAQRIIDLGGQEAALKYLESVANRHSAPSAETVAIGEQLILDAQAVGDVNAFEKAVVYTAMIGTAAGQTVQAFSMINKLSPQGIALYMNRVIERLNNVEYKDLIAKGKMKPIELTEDQTARILGVHSFADATRVQTEILTEIAQQIPLTMKEQLRSWRYLCMLGNVRTNVRNIAGNLAMAAMRSGKDVIAAGLEAWDVKRGQRLEQKAAEAAQAGDTARAEKLRERADRHLAQSDRTKALGIGANADAFRANKAYARGTLADAETLLKGGGKDVGLSVLREEKRMFNNKVLNKIGKAALAPLDLFDMKFLAPQYVNAYASWMTARGLTGENMTLKQRSEAMTYAVSEAQKATFRDANWLATKLTEIRSRNLATELVVGGVMPFAKTPANVLRRGIEYSPAGILQGFAQIYRANNDSTLSHADRMKLRAEAIDRLASGTTGTGLLAIGIALRALGVLRGKDDDDSRASKFFRDMGRQAYSFQIGGTSITLDWLAPMNMPMFMGVAVYDIAEQLAGGEDLDWKDIAEPLLSIADPMIEMSMLSGIQSALKTYGSENALSAVATNTLQSFAGQFYPTIGGQLARTIDTTRRAPDSKHYWIQSMMAKIPGLSKLVKPYVGGYGEEEEFEPTDSAAANYILRGIEQFISPGYVKGERNDELTTELARLYESTGVNKFLPQRPSDYKQLNLGKEYGTIDLTQEEQVEYEKLFRSEAAKALDAAVKAPGYRGLPDADKADLLSEVYNAATKDARKQYKQKMIERHFNSVAATKPKK